MVAIWSQFRAAVARLGVWRHFGFWAVFELEHQIQDLVLYPSEDESPSPALLKSRLGRPSAL